MYRHAFVCVHLIDEQLHALLTIYTKIIVSQQELNATVTRNLSDTIKIIKEKSIFKPKILFTNSHAIKMPQGGVLSFFLYT